MRPIYDKICLHFAVKTSYVWNQGLFQEAGLTNSEPKPKLLSWLTLSWETFGPKTDQNYAELAQSALELMCELMCNGRENIAIIQHGIWAYIFI